MTDQEQDGTVNRDSAEGVRRMFDGFDTELSREADDLPGAPGTAWAVLVAARYLLAGMGQLAVQVARVADGVEGRTIRIIAKNPALVGAAANPISGKGR